MKNILIFLFLVCGFSVKATTYYVSVSGSNLNNGLSVLTPWQTCSKVESQVLLPGDSVLFKAGDAWREILDLNESGTSGNYIYYGRYGSGKNPVFLGSTRAIEWTPTATANVWQTATSLVHTSDDYYAGRMFFMVDDSVTWGVYKTYVNLSELTQEFDYCVNGTTHYVYSTTDPDTRYDSIEVTQREQCISMHFMNYIEFNGIDAKFGQRQGFYEGYPVPRGCTDMIFRNCTIQYIGFQGSGAAYGITAFYSNLLVENCYITDCGRRAVSVNTYTDWTGGRKIENIIVRNNVFKRGYHTTSLDISTQNRTGDTVMNVYFYNNYVDDSERPTSTPTSNQLFTQGGISTSRMSDIYIVGNVFIQSTATVMNLENSITHYIWNNTIIALNPSKTTSPYGTISLNGADTVDLRNNILYDNVPNNTLQNNLIHGYPTPDITFKHRDYNLYYSLYPKTDRNFTSVNIGGTRTFWRTTQWNEFKVAFPDWEVHSPTPQNPNFVDYAANDLHLSATSEAIRSGTVIPYVIITDPSGSVDTINKYDIDGNVRSRTSPSLGAYEFELPPNILYIGNSFTEYGPLRLMVDSIAKSLGHAVPYSDHSIASGQSLYYHRTNSTTLSHIQENPNGRDWDYIVLQDLSTRAYTDSLGMMSDVLWFYDYIKTYNSSAKVVLYETWATLIPSSVQDTWYSNNSPSLLAQWDVLQSIVRRSYENSALNITQNSTSSVKTDTIIARVGEKWKNHFHSNDPFRLHLTNDIHPNDAGIYLNGLAMFNAIYNEPVTGAGYWDVTQEQAIHLQNIVDTTFSPEIDLNNETDILTFTITGYSGISINTTTGSITVNMPFGSVVTSLSPAITLSAGATINPASGISRNFSSPVTYIVTAEDGVTERTWTVTVSVSEQPQTSTHHLKYNGKFVKYNGKFVLL